MSERIDIRVERATVYKGVEHWYAYDDCTYDGAPDSGSVQGSGNTKWAAIRELLDLMEESELGYTTR